MPDARRVRIASVIGAVLLSMFLTGCALTTTQTGTPANDDVAHHLTLPTRETNGPPSVVRIATFNIRHGRGLDDRVDLERVAEWIRSAAIDILVLQEVDSGWPRSGYESQLDRLAELTDLPYRLFAPTLRLAGGPNAPDRLYGNGILSRFPLQDAQVYSLPRHFPSEPRNLVRVEVRLDAGDPLVLWTTHLSTKPAERDAQLAHIAMLASPLERALLLGDLNTTPEGAAFQGLLAAGWIDLWDWSHSAPGPTFPADHPTKRIDYILASPRVLTSVRAVDRGITTASDHLPVFVEIALTQPDSAESIL